MISTNSTSKHLVTNANDSNSVDKSSSPLLITRPPYKKQIPIISTSNSFDNSITNKIHNNHYNHQKGGSTSELKSYLIDKLIYETPEKLTSSTMDQSSKINGAINSNNNNKHHFDSKNYLKMSNLKKTDSNDDLLSETGTYTVDDGPDIANQADLDDNFLNEKNLKLVSKQQQQNEIDENETDLLLMRQSTNTIDLMSARAAIDETFGITINRPSIHENENMSVTNSAANSSLQKPTAARSRNKTYSLKDLIKPNENSSINLNINNNSSSCSESPSSSISSLSVSTHLTNNSNKPSSATIKKTTTYEVIANKSDNNLNEQQNQRDQQSLSSRTNGTIVTDLLLGDTEKLMEQIKKRRQEKKEQLKMKFQSNKVASNDDNNNNNKQVHLFSASSTSSSSTNVSVGNAANTDDNNLVKANETGKLNSSWTIPKDDEAKSLSATTIDMKSSSNEKVNDNIVISMARATLVNLKDREEEQKQNDSQCMTLMQLNKVGNGGVSFDFVIQDNNNNNNNNNKLKLVNSKSPPTTSRAFNFALYKKRNSADRSVNSSSSICSNSSQSCSDCNNNNNNNNNVNMINKDLSCSSSSSPSDRSINMSITQGFEQMMINRLNQSTATNTSSTTMTGNSPRSLKSGVSLGAKIQAKAKENSISPKHNKKSTETTIDQPSLSNSCSFVNKKSSEAPNTNRALLLRQQLSKTKLDSSNNHAAVSSSSSLNGNGLSSQNSSKKASPQPQQQQKTNSAKSSPTKKQLTSASSAANSRSNSRNTSPFTSNPNKPSSLMTNSLNLPYGSQLPSSSSVTNANDLFKRRKNYDPMKSVEMDKLRKLEQQQQQLRDRNLNESQIMPSASTSSLSNNHRSNSIDYIINKKKLSNAKSDDNKTNTTIIESEKLKQQYQQQQLQLNNQLKLQRERSHYLENGNAKANNNSRSSINGSNSSINNMDNMDSFSESSFNSFSVPLQQLATNISNKQNYEAILESTLQRLCIRLIQMSTGVLDKIGSNNSNNYESSLFNMLNTTELERMQQLAKLVNSMQIINDHVQVIDSTFFSPKPEESYIKELTKIRKEVDNLKQKASLNSSTSSISSSIVNNNGNQNGTASNSSSGVTKNLNSNSTILMQN